MVPITSDLAGYMAFWSRAVLMLGIPVAGLLLTQCWLLWSILQAVKK